jgi:predicted O-methyltransferase YrrM
MYTLIKDLPGWCSEDKFNKMYSLIKKINPDKLLEIGVFGGKSLFSQALALKDNKNGHIIGIDSWDKKDCIQYMTDPVAIEWWSKLDYASIYKSCMKFIKENKLKKYCSLYKGTTKEYRYQLRNDIDILHIDGNHEEASSCYDVETYVPFVKKNGYIWFDDANWHQTKKAVNIIETKFKCRLIDKAKSDDPNNFCNLYIKT